MIRTEYFMVCNTCSVYLGEDQGDEDYLESSVISLIDYARECGWHTNDLDPMEENICHECWTTKKEDRHATTGATDQRPT